MDQQQGPPGGHEPAEISDEQFLALARATVVNQARWVALVDASQGAEVAHLWQAEVDEFDVPALTMIHSADGVSVMPVPPYLWQRFQEWLAGRNRWVAAVPLGRVVPEPGAGADLAGGPLYVIVSRPTSSLFPADDPPEG